MYRVKFYPVENNSKNALSCLVAGFGGKLKSYHRAVKCLNDAGYDVIAFEYDRSVLENGNPEGLLKLIDSVNAEVSSRARSYDSVLCTGVSLGAYVAFNVQRRLQKAKIGIYGTAGISVSHAIFSARVFKNIRLAFMKNGFNEETLRNKWKTIEILDDVGLDPSKSLMIVMGKLDRIVRYKTASKVMDSWKEKGTRVSYFGLRGRGHALTIRWYKNNLSKLLT